MDTNSEATDCRKKAQCLNEDSQFDLLMSDIGNNGNGYFLKRFHIVFSTIFTCTNTMAFFNHLMALSVPDHHCHVPGRNLTNYTLAEWQALMIPKSENDELSHCTMYKRNHFGNLIINETQSCTHGWDYDTTWYTITVPSQHDWVCGNEVFVANTYAASKFGEILGLLVLAPMADLVGRKSVYFASLGLSLAGRMLTIAISDYLYLFVFMVAFSSIARTFVFHASFVIGTEMSNEKGRDYLLLLQCLGCTIGVCVLPLLTWWLGDWRAMIIATTLPSALAFCCYRVMPESPRWLASRGKVDQAMQVVDYIAKVNKKQRPKNTQQVIQAMARKKEKTYGLASLVANIRLARYTFLLIICWMSFGTSYFTVLLNATNMGGNPFMNFFWQSLMDFPGYAIAQYICKSLGKRWLNVSGSAVGAFFCAILLASHGGPHWLTIMLTCCIKLSSSLTYYALAMLSVEVYPTCVRQTGLSLGGMVVNVAGILAAYVVFWGQTQDPRFPTAAILTISLAGALCGAYLPETHGQRLPETLEDAKTFGADQKFWSFNKPKTRKLDENHGRNSLLDKNVEVVEALLSDKSDKPCDVRKN